MSEIPNCYYRVSAKALILNEARDKFLVCEEENGVWELPGGGLDWGATPQQDIPREIAEEMGLETTYVADNPSYFITDQTLRSKQWIVNVVYEAGVKDLDFTPSDECVSLKFINKENIEDINAFPTVQQLARMFNPKNH